MTDLISRADAIEAAASITMSIHLSDVICDKLMALPSAEAETKCIAQIKVDTEELVRRIKEEYDITDEWIPCSERLPEDLEAVNVTWVNHNPPVYYQYTKDVPNADTAVYYRGVWYWWDSTICDVLGEYGEKCGAEQIDKDIEIIAWMPLPKPYKGGDDE